MKASRIKTALLGSGAAVALLAAGGPASADEISDLRQQIDEMQDRVARIEAERAEDRRVASAAAVEAGDKPRSWKLPGTNTSMSIGGYAKLDIIFDLDGSLGGGNPTDFKLAHLSAPDTGPLGSTAQPTVRLHARQTRLFVRTWTPTDWGELATHFEGDFYGAPGGVISGVDSGRALRLRHGYGRLGPILAGQTWSTFMPIWSNPETIDFAGPTGDIFVRQGQLRFTHSFGNGWQFQAAIEDPVTGTNAVRFNTGGPLAVATLDHRFPDIIVNIRKSHNWFGRGLIGAGVMVRDLNFDAGPVPGVTNVSDSALGWGVYIAWAHIFNDRFRMGAQGHIGQGHQKYLATATGTPEAVIFINNQTVTLDPIFGIGGFIWGRFNWTDNLRSSLVFGYQHIDPTSGGSTKALLNAGPGLGIPTGWPGDQGSIHANLIWSTVPQVNIGVEYTYHWAQYIGSGGITGINGDAHRLQFGFQYRF